MLNMIPYEEYGYLNIRVLYNFICKNQIMGLI